METRLQARVDAHDSKIVSMETSVQELIQSVATMKETMVKGQQEHVEFKNLFMNFLKEQEKRPNRNGGDGPSSSGEASEVDDLRLLAKRVELPPFEGADPQGWLTKAETYFRIHQTHTEHRIPMAQVCMDGPVVHWFTILTEVYPDITWEQFEVELLARFSGLEQYVGYFLNGLKDDIRSGVRVYNPESRLKAMQLTRNVEVALRKGGDRSFRGAGPFPRLTQHGPVTSTYSSTTWPPSFGKSRDSGQGILSGNGSEGVSRK
ncbi:putative retrotransposon gag domain-containing protein [Sesbania bispinosa]|nr:putative retrotransposon gag domain-containing protein [Sesbania bispinosa]